MPVLLLKNPQLDGSQRQNLHIRIATTLRHLNYSWKILL